MLTRLSIWRIITNTKQKGEILCLPGVSERCKYWSLWRIVHSDILNGLTVGSKAGHTLNILNAV